MSLTVNLFNDISISKLQVMHVHVFQAQFLIIISRFQFHTKYLNVTVAITTKQARSHVML